MQILIQKRCGALLEVYKHFIKKNETIRLRFNKLIFCFLGLETFSQLVIENDDGTVITFHQDIIYEESIYLKISFI